MKYLFWDIDGTLLTTNFAGLTALNRMVLQKFHKIYQVNFSHGMAGMTDTYIIDRILEELTGEVNPATVEECFALYNELLPGCMVERNGHLLPRVRESLACLATHQEDFVQLLLTGNCREAAYTKTKHFGIEGYFNFDLSAFGRISENRGELAKEAFLRLREHLSGNLDPRDMIVIGDTPHDIECAHVIGARSLIIRAGSSYELEELAEKKPWKIIDVLPEDPESLVRLLSEE